MKRTYAKSIGEIIDLVLKEEHLDGKLNEQRALAVWPEIVGQGINRYTTDRRISRGVLTVSLSSAALRNELMMYRSDLVSRINEAVGTQVITDIVFR